MTRLTQLPLHYQMLIAQGIPASRLSIISYGKERPSDRAHNEAAWAQNRRAEFIWRAN